MKSLTNNNSNSFKSKTLGLALAAVLIPGGLALAHDGGAYKSRDAIVRNNLSGHVEVVHEIPGGVITVGADWGKRPPVIVEHRQVVERREVVVVEKKHGHGWGHHKNREVTIIREEPRRTVTVIHTEPARPKVVVIEKRDDGCNRNEVVRTGDDLYYEDAHQVSVQDNRDGRNRNVYVRK